MKSREPLRTLAITRTDDGLFIWTQVWCRRWCGTLLAFVRLRLRRWLLLLHRHLALRLRLGNLLGLPLFPLHLRRLIRLALANRSLRCRSRGAAWLFSLHLRHLLRLALANRSLWHWSRGAAWLFP